MDTPQKINQLNNRYAIPGVMLFEPGEGGLTRAVIESDQYTGSVYLHGAHVTDFQPAGHQPVLFMSSRSKFDEDLPIRGGVPICFPWFGRHATDKDAPIHGTARIRPWGVESVNADKGIVTLVLALAIESFRIRHCVAFGKTLSMTLLVENTSSNDARFEAALHTYLAVGDVRQASITGLENAEYIDDLDAGERKNQGGAPITFTGETDRVYLDNQPSCTLIDPAMGRKITVSKSGSDATVVWNPWINKAKALPDLGDDDWPNMVCIETVNAGPCAVMLQPGATHQMNATIRVEPL